MHPLRSRVARAALAATVAVAAFGVAVASADDLPTSTPDIYRATSDVDVLRSQLGVDGTGVTVAIIDTGVADVPGMGDAVIHQQNISAAPDAGDQYGHGTFVAGLVHEVAPGAKIVSVKLSGQSGAVDVTQVLAALQWVVANKQRFSIDVVNLSFGSDSKQPAADSPLNFAVQRVWDAGMVVVSSAGNLGSASGTVTKPGDDPLIITVGASDDRGSDRRSDDVVAPFGSRGPTQDGYAKPDVVASGTRVVSLRAPGSAVDVANPQARIGDDRFRGSGTSFAAPIVSGIVALMLDADPTLVPDQVKFGLLKSGDAISGEAMAAGTGTARASKALTAAQSGWTPQQVTRSTGTGSLHAARGSAIVKVRTKVRGVDDAVSDVDVEVRGNHTAEVPPEAGDAVDIGDGTPIEEATDDFDPGEFRNAQAWDASQWGASQWGASQWGASQWGASQWGASQWGASQWGSAQWWASQWG